MKSLRILSASFLIIPSLAFESGLSVTTKPSVNTSVPLGAQRVLMQTITLTADCTDDVTVRGLTVHRSGLGDTSDIEGVYVMGNNRRISRARTFGSSDHTAELDLRGFVIKACTTATLDVYINISPTALVSGQHAIGIESPDDVHTDASNVTVGATAAPATVQTAPTSAGSLHMEFLPLRGTVRYGVQRTIGRFKLTADDEDQIIKQITLTNDGSARNGDLKNLVIVHSNSTIASDIEAMLDEDTVTFTFSPPLLVKENHTRLFTIRADIRASKSKTIGLGLEEPSDVLTTSKNPRGGFYQ